MGDATFGALMFDEAKFWQLTTEQWLIYILTTFIESEASLYFPA